MSATKKEILLDQMAACHNDLSWFPTFTDAVKGLTPGQAAWRSHPSSHSIWELVQHLIYWNEKWMSYFLDKETFVSIGKNNDKTFGDPDVEVNEERWNAAVQRLEAVYTEWRNVLHEYPESKFETQVPGYHDEAPWWGVLSNLCTHNAYHIGQIVLIRKLQEQGTE
ncbi:DinB family protein [Melghirimyces profundicolus]|uniref:DinB family protein n=1 Tax=Melghirimyces profundicolus TaxID=1242148 RepID=A0A2T6AYJ6_9BACL|nr:DinB family protein [Melghirimyces profundicolus]PTX48884.1 DinB family protein [Melghirimyces profundicolus]